MITLALPLRAAEPLRLEEIGVTRFVEKEPGQIWLQRALYGPFRGFRITEENPVIVSVPIPPAVLNKIMIQLEAWYALQRLSPEALVNFSANLELTHTVGSRTYTEVSIVELPKMDAGRLVNIAARSQASRSNKLIVGFTIHDQSRWVLIRAVGPGLRKYDMNDAMEDPRLTVFKGRLPILTNDDWNDRPDSAAAAAAATKVGAFPLEFASNDAAILVELEPGSFTVHAEPETGADGSVLVEVYSVPNS